MNAMHEIDYQIHGDAMQFVEIELDPMEAAVAEAGGMMYMDDGIEMETIFGDGSQQNTGFMGALMGAGKRLLTGESLFMTVFQNRGQGKKRVAFGAPYPGKIIPVKLSEIGGEIWAQKDSFLCAAKGVSVGIAFNKKIGAGLFGGEGFIMQRLQGDGWAFLNAGGNIYERVLAPGLVPYAATKGAVKIFTQGLARELGSRGITVNNVQPGPIETDLNPATGDWSVPQKAMTALKRYGHVEDIAAMVAFVAGPEASYITGANLTVDGGTNA